MSAASVDAVGVPHPRVAADAARIVSLVPSLTELLCDLGLARSIVGRTGYCIHPAAAVKDIPKVGGTKTVNVAKIRALAPTHLVVNVDENEKPTVDALAAFVPHVVVTHPKVPADNRSLYALFGTLFDRPREAADLTARFDDALAALARPRPERRVLYLIWKDPWMTVARDTYVAAMLDLVSWRHVDPAPSATGGAARYPAIDLARAATSADRVLLSSEPYRFTASHVAALTASLKKDVRLVDGEMLSWYGSRAIDGLRYLGTLPDA